MISNKGRRKYKTIPARDLIIGNIVNYFDGHDFNLYTVAGKSVSEMGIELNLNPIGNESPRDMTVDPERGFSIQV